MFTPLLFIFAFYTQYKYSSDIINLLEDPVSMALGGNHSVSMWEPASAYYNPASSSKKIIGASHFSYFSNFIGVENIGISGIKSGIYTTSFYVSYIHSKPIELTQLADSQYGITDGNIVVKDKKPFQSLSAYFALQRKIKQYLSLGIDLHYITEQLPDYSIFDIGIDAGFVYTPSSFITIGGKIRNLTTARLENGSKEVLRPSFDITALTKSKKIHTYFTISSEYDKQKDYSLFAFKDLSISASLGMEYYISPRILIRAGTGNYGMGLGAGLRFKKIYVDYGIRPFHTAGITHKLALSYHIE